MSQIDVPMGKFEITASLDDRVRTLSRAPSRIGKTAFPIFAFVGALGGMGWKIADLSEALNLPFHRGPVLARSRLSFETALVVDRTYDVKTTVECIESKPSRTFGWAEHLHLAISLTDEMPFSTARLHIVFPGSEGRT